MSDSLKDQLLALGLASKKPVVKKPRKQVPAVAKKKSTDAEISLDQAYRIRNKEVQRQKEQAIALKLEQERRRRETNTKIKASVKENAVRDPEADTKRNFLFKGRIRSVLATREQVIEINNGTLGVVYLSGNYHLMPADKIEEIRQYAPDHVPDLRGADGEGEEENPVPDDLIW